MMKRPRSWALLMGILSLLLGCSESSYYKKGGKWHYDGVPVDRHEEPVDFKVLDRYFAKDRRTAFYQGQRIGFGPQPSDPATFEVLNSWYAKDKFRVYYCDTERDSREYWSVKHIRIKVVEAADPATFRMMSDGYTPRDRSHVFEQVSVIPIRDIDSYELLAHAFSKDKVSAYLAGRELLGSDGATFSVLDPHYARDKATVYSAARRGGVRGVRLASFKALGRGYASDGNRAYFQGAVITQRDAHTLITLENTGYAKTIAQVFYEGTLLPDADAATFVAPEKVEAQFDASDRLGRWRVGERVGQVP
jgi:hypothetical protein